MPVKHEMPSVSPPEFTTLTHNNPLVERFLRWPMVVLLMIGGKCSLFASKPAHISGHLPPVPKDSHGKPAIHYTTVYKVFARWSDDGSLEDAFIASVQHFVDQHQLDLSVLHGDGTNTVATKGGDGIGYAGHKHQKGEKVIAIIDNNGYVLAPLPVAPVNAADTVLVPEGLKGLKRVAKLTGLVLEGA